MKNSNKIIFLIGTFLFLCNYATAQVYDACCSCDDRFGICVKSKSGRGYCDIPQGTKGKPLCYTIDSFGAIVVSCVKNENWVYNGATGKYQLGNCNDAPAGVGCKIRDCADGIAARGMSCNDKGFCSHESGSDGTNDY